MQFLCIKAVRLSYPSLRFLTEISSELSYFHIQNVTT